MKIFGFIKKGTREMSQNIFCKYCHRIPNQCNCTHPVKELTKYMKYRLAVKEFGEGFCITYRSELLAYADAILRKAQGK